MSMETPPLDAPPQPQAGDNTFRFVFNVLSDHRVMVLAGTLVGAVVMAVVSFMIREVSVPSYEAFADVGIVLSPWEQGLLADMGGVTLSPSPVSICKQTDLSTLSEEIATALIQRDLEEGGPLSRISTNEEKRRYAQHIESCIALEPDDQYQKIRLKVSGCESAREAEEIAEFGIRVFLAQNQELKMEEGRKQHAFLKEELAKASELLSEATDREWKFKQETGFRTFGTLDEDMAKMEAELETITVTMQETTAKLSELEAELQANTDQLPEALGRVTETSVSGLLGELDELLQEKLSMSAVFQPGFEKLQLLEEEIADKQAAVLDAVNQLDGGQAGGSSVWKRRQDIYRQQMDLRMAQTGYEVRAASLRRQLEDLIPKIPELANENRHYEELKQETERYREHLRTSHKKEWDLRMALRKGGGSVERQGSAHQATVMSPPSTQNNIAFNMIIGAILGFICAFGFAMMLEVNDTSIRSIEDVNTYIGLEVLGTIPKMRFGKPRGGRRKRATYVTTVDEEQIDACIVTQHDPKSPISEAYRTLRTNYQFATINQRPKSLMVTSAVPGEGKTTTAVNMAVTMADRGIRVLIVDTDLRRPNVHRVLRMERGPGLADVLREGLDVHSVIRSTRVDNLWIISSGRVPPNPSELIGSDLMSRVMKQLSDEFDLVICDAPSVLVVTDPVLLATHVDTCIMVVSTNNARRETVIRAKKLLETARVNVVGVTVNGLETTRRHYYYYYYYYDDGAPVRRKWYHFY